MEKLKVGRKEVLTLDLAKKICRMIEMMPDVGIPVTWENVSKQAEKKFGHGFNRQMLSQKAWEGRKLIAERFSQAKAAQRRIQRDGAPKYQSGSRGMLQRRIVTLEAKVLALQEELERTRGHQYEKLDVFRSMKLDLCRAFGESNDG